MNVREIVRRGVIWATAGGCLVLSVWGALLGDPMALLQMSGMAIVGAVILGSRPGNVIGRFLLAAPVATVPDLTLRATGLVHSVPAWVEATASFFNQVSMTILIFAVLFYPSGTVTTVAGRWLLRLSLGVTAAFAVVSIVSPFALLDSGRANPWAVPALAPLYGDREFGLTDVLWLAIIVLAAIAFIELLFRWRGSGGIERLQYRWFAYGIGLYLTAIGICIAAMFSPWALVLYAAATNAIPICIGIAITRHGLYEIGRVVSRSVSYAIVTATAVGVYLLVVTSVTWLIPAASSLAVATATLTAAAVFLPLLRSVQRRLDRRFDRERYDGRAVVDAFGERLRTDVTLDTTTRDLGAAVQRALQPASVGLWTREERS